jgi:hypothetical protein
VNPREQAACHEGTLDAREMAMIVAIFIEALHPVGAENEPRFQSARAVVRSSGSLLGYAATRASGVVAHRVVI